MTSSAMRCHTEGNLVKLGSRTGILSIRWYQASIITLDFSCQQRILDGHSLSFG